MQVNDQEPILPPEKANQILDEAYAREAQFRKRRDLVQRLCAELSAAVDHLRKVLEKVAGSSGVMLKVDQDAARNQVQRAEDLLRAVPYENPHFTVDEDDEPNPASTE